MDLPAWALYPALIVMAVVATWWVVWPQKYVAWLQAATRKLRQYAAAQAGHDRLEETSREFEFVRSFPSKPWYPQLTRSTGIVLWIMVLWMIAHRL